ncbi:MAG: chemotaxis protein CheW [Verrucomicrobiota bacterium]
MLNFDRELLDGFIQESREHLDTLETDLVVLEAKKDDTEVINRIFRAVHTIKGGAGFLGLENIGSLAHTMENMMSLVREGTLPITKSMVDALLFSTDKLRLMISDPEHSAEQSIKEEMNSLQAQLQNPSEQKEESKGPEPFSTKEAADPLHVLQDLDSYLLKDAIKTGRQIYLVRLFTKKDIDKKKKTPLDVLKEIESFGEFLECYTDISSIDGLENAMSTDIIHVFVVSTLLDKASMPDALDIPAEQIEEIPTSVIEQFLEGATSTPAVPTTPVPAPVAPTAPASTPIPMPTSSMPTSMPISPPVMEKKITPIKIEEKSMEISREVVPVKENAMQPSTPNTSLAPASNSTEETKQHKTDETIRVSVDLLDDLMNLAGEMVLGRNQLLRVSEVASKQIPGMPTILQNISLVTSEMQEKVMRTRLQPIGTILGKFTRIIRDLSRKLEKEIDLKISGEDVELDRSIIEALADPLTHLIRNSVDHGIEMPSERERLGKRRMGTVQLIASHVGGQVLIEIIDDGKGIDPERMKRKAVEKKVLKVEEAERMSDRQAMNLIFLPGFSTAEAVSDLSGRGVGMDVVRTNIENVGGSVELDSQVGKGTRVSLRLPLTLAIIPAMIVGVRDRRFAVPQVDLEEIVNLGINHHLEDVRGVSVLRLRGKLLPLVSLAEVLKLQSTPSDHKEKSETTIHDRGYVLVLKVNNNRYGVIVDELLDSEEIVVKPLSSYLKSAQSYSGATIMGDGKVALILDSSGIVQLADLKFEEIHREALADSSLQLKEDAAGEAQSLLLFRNDPTELFAINLALVARIEEIHAKDIEHVGASEYLKYRDSSLRLLRLHDCMSVKRPENESETLYVIVPKLVRFPMGIVATKIEDVVRSAVTLDEETVRGVGVLGSAVINEELVVFVDVYSLFEKADPDKYKWLKKTSALQGKRILLAEDTAFFRSVEIQYLKELACQVDVAANGIEALEKLNHDHYDLLLTDLEMPGMDGFELTQRVRSNEKLKKIPIVALTALSSERYHQRGKEAGVDAYEVKLDKERLRLTLENIFKKESDPIDVPSIR